MQIKFELMLYCTTGWDDDESTAFLEVYSFEELVEATTLLNKNRHMMNDEEKETYDEYRKRMESESWKEISYLGEVRGVRCTYSDGKGASVTVTLDDEEGANGKISVNGEEYANGYKELLNKAKSLACDIANL